MIESKTEVKAGQSAPLVSIGWVLAADERGPEVLEAYMHARQLVQDIMAIQFSSFRWEMPFVERRIHQPFGALDILPLLEVGAQEKVENSWDYAIVVVPNELIPRHRVFTLGAPSSALEVGVMSSARLPHDERLADCLAALALQLLRHLWGLARNGNGSMVVPADGEVLSGAEYTEEEKSAIMDRLVEVADQRLEEKGGRLGWLSFHWHSFKADPAAILADTWSYSPWRLPFQMGRLTAASAVTLLVFLLAAEAWEVGVNLGWPTLGGAAVGSVLGSTTFIYLGQNLGEVSREVGWREQLARTRIVLLLMLFTGMAALWCVLLCISYSAALLVPADVVTAWVGFQAGWQDLLRHSAFLASLGVFAAALGGNLEEEDEFKARLFCDDEI